MTRLTLRGFADLLKNAPPLPAESAGWTIIPGSAPLLSFFIPVIILVVAIWARPAYQFVVQLLP
ncbi:hypothetical protein C4568_01020 [Candidatus Parcubacteria bacterium]|nr:MAG: hypothetical protein C4568_01020 [Candidatus Parcubacteria bacterium]